MTSTIQPRELDLPMTMPQTGGWSQEETLNVLLGIRDDGAVVMNWGDDAELLDSDVNNRELPNTKERLKMMNQMALSSDTELMVQVYAVEGVTQQRVIDVISCLRGEGIVNLTLTDTTAD